jgi:hypothetical protein
MPYIVLIIEEFVLLGLVPYNDLPPLIGLLNDRYTIACQLEGHEVAVQLKNACLSLT